MKHTPGPWTAECRDAGYSGGRWPEDRFLQWEVEGPKVPSGRGEYYQADARLIAAAPEMLDALEDVALRCEELHDYANDTNKPDLLRTAEIARRAVSKAKGDE